MVSNNIHNIYIDSFVNDNNQDLNLTFEAIKKDPIVVNKNNISGNSITKKQTIRSKISIEPIEYFKNIFFKKYIKKIKRYPYIKI